MVEMVQMSERKRRRSEGDAAAAAAAAVGVEQRSTRRMNGVSDGTGVAVENGREQHVNGRDHDDEEHKESEESSTQVNGFNGVHHEEEEEKMQHKDIGVARNGSGSGEQETHEADEADDDDEEEEEDDVLVVLELTDFKNHPIFDDYRSIRIEGINTASPMLQIGEYTLYGQLEETVGTNFFYDTTSKTPEGKYQYVGQTTKKIKFTIAPPEP